MNLHLFMLWPPAIVINISTASYYFIYAVVSKSAVRQCRDGAFPDPHLYCAAIGEGVINGADGAKKATGVWSLNIL